MACCNVCVPAQMREHEVVKTMANRKSVIFGKKFRELRKLRKVTVKELAEYFNCSTSLIYNIEKGINDPQTGFIIRASEYFEVSTDYLLKDKETKILVDKEDELQLVKAYRALPQGLRDSHLRLMSDTATNVSPRRL